MEIKRSGSQRPDRDAEYFTAPSASTRCCGARPARVAGASVTFEQVPHRLAYAPLGRLVVTAGCGRVQPKAADRGDPGRRCGLVSARSEALA